MIQVFEFKDVVKNKLGTLFRINVGTELRPHLNDNATRYNASRLNVIKGKKIVNFELVDSPDDIALAIADKSTNLLDTHDGCFTYVSTFDELVKSANVTSYSVVR